MDNNNNINDDIKKEEQKNLKDWSKSPDYVMDSYLPAGFPVDVWGYSNNHELNLGWILHELKKYRYVYYKLYDIISDIVENKLSEISYDQILGVMGYVNVLYPPNKMEGLDPSGQTNNTAKLMEIFAWMRDNDKCLLYFPSGDYLLDCFTLPTGMTIMGECVADTRLLLAPNQKQPGMIYGTLADSSICNITIDCNMASQNIEVSGIDADMEYAKIIGCDIVNAAYGIKAKIEGDCEIANCGIYYPYISHMYVFNAGLTPGKLTATSIYMGEMTGNLVKDYCIQNCGRDMTFSGVYSDCKLALGLVRDKGERNSYTISTSGETVPRDFISGDKMYIKINGYTEEIANEYWRGRIANYNLNSDNISIVAGEITETATTVTEQYNDLTSTIGIWATESTSESHRSDNLVIDAASEKHVNDALYFDTAAPIKYSETHTAGAYFDAVDWQDKLGITYAVLVDKNSSAKIKQDLDNAAGNINAEIDNLESRVSQNERDIADEASNRETADADIYAKLQKETEDRVDGDNALENKIVQEIEDRVAGDNQLASDIKNAVIEFDSALDALDDKVTRTFASYATITAMQAADQHLQDQIDLITGDLTGDFTEINAKIDKNTTDIATINTNVSSLDTRVETIEDDISAIGEQATNAVEVAGQAKTAADSAMDKATEALRIANIRDTFTSRSFSTTINRGNQKQYHAQVHCPLPAGFTSQLSGRGFIIQNGFSYPESFITSVPTSDFYGGVLDISPYTTYTITCVIDFINQPPYTRMSELPLHTYTDPDGVLHQTDNIDELIEIMQKFDPDIDVERVRNMHNMLQK